MRSLPTQTAEARADLVDNIESAMNEKIIRYMIQRAHEKRDRLFPPGYTGPEATHDIKTIARMAELFTITEPMLDLVHFASTSMPPQELHREQVPTQDGFLWLPKPLRLVDIGGYVIPIQAIMWHEMALGGRPEYHETTTARGLLLHLFVVNGGPEDSLREKIDPRGMAQMIARMGLLGLTHIQGVGFGMKMWNPDATALDLSPEQRANIARKMRNLQDGEVVEGSLDERGTFLVRTEDGDEIRIAPDSVVQFMSAFFSFYRSVLTGLDREFPAQSSARWLRRLSLDNSPVTVLRLRKREPGAETGRGFALSYRHVRRGHWRRQPYGPRANPTYEYIWIAPTVVGDESLPLRKRDVVNIIVR